MARLTTSVAALKMKNIANNAIPAAVWRGLPGRSDGHETIVSNNIFAAEVPNPR